MFDRVTNGLARLAARIENLPRSPHLAVVVAAVALLVVFVGKTFQQPPKPSDRYEDLYRDRIRIEPAWQAVLAGDDALQSGDLVPRPNGTLARSSSTVLGMRRRRLPSSTAPWPSRTSKDVRRRLRTRAAPSLCLRRRSTVVGRERKSCWRSIDSMRHAKISRPLRQLRVFRSQYSLTQSQSHLSFSVSYYQVT